MEGKTLVTIAIPFYNTELYLGFAIQSVINQTYSDWELLLIDDGSSDHSYKIAKKFADRDSRIKLYKDGKNKGLPARLNESVRMAKGKYYARMDDDDIMEIHRIEQQLLYMQNHPEVDVLGTSVMRINVKNEIVGSISQEGKVNNFVHPTVMAKTSWFLEHPYNEKQLKAQDYELWLRTHDNSTFYNMPNPLLFYRDIGIPTHKKYAKSMKGIRQIARHYKNYNKSLSWAIKLWINSYFKQIFYYIFGIVGKTDVLIKHRNVISIPSEKCLTNENLVKSIT